MADYLYTKSPVDIDSLTIAINNSSISSSVYDHAVFNKPDYLKITFTGSLSGADEATLDDIVSNHTGATSYVASGYIAVADGEGGILFIVPETVVSGISASANIDGGSSISLYGGTDGIDGGSSISLYGGVDGIDGGNASSFN